MISISENQTRDHIFDNHKENFPILITGRRDPIEWTGDGFPTISFLLQRHAEKKINEILENLEELVLTAKEMRLERNAPHATRIDLFGNSASTEIAVIELKKSSQTACQAEGTHRIRWTVGLAKRSELTVRFGPRAVVR